MSENETKIMTGGGGRPSTASNGKSGTDDDDDIVVTKDDETILQDDNPCWGSPTECSLTHMLTQYPKKSCLIYESPYYVILNKPPDLRMDGNYPATVHKLLTLWYPPPSIANDDDLEGTISKLHRHSSLDDNALRPCHQLDYATSGLLCVARTREAARFAIRQWEQRRVRKTYLAVIETNLLLTDNTTTIPKLTSNQIQSTLQRLESTYKKTRIPDPKKRSTFLGFQPVHAIYQKFKGKMINAGKATPKTKKRPRADVLISEQWDYIWQPVQDVLTKGVTDSMIIPEESVKLICSSDWKIIERTKPEWKVAFIEATERHNNLFRVAMQKDDDEETSPVLTTFPTIFGEKTNDEGEEEEDHSNLIYISCPLAVDPDAFPMKVPESLVSDFPHMKSFVGSPSLDYKPSLTKCTILSTFEKNGQTYTKVELLPMTGRRHQLRVHMALLAGRGYGILGDATYNIHTSPLSELRKKDEATRPERMCLHSHRLSLRLLVEDTKEIGESVDLVAPDPF